MKLHQRDRLLVLGFSVLAVVAPVLGLDILTDCLDPSMPSGVVKRAFLLETFRVALLRTAFLFAALLTPSLLTRWLLELRPAARRARRVAEVSTFLTCTSLAAWILLARLALLRQ